MARTAALVGIIAGTQEGAKALIRELGLTTARVLPKRSSSIEGMRLSAVIVDESALPLADHIAVVVHRNLLKTAGSVGMYELRRVGV